MMVLLSRSRAIFCRCFSTSSCNRKIYELRRYEISPLNFPAFLQLTNEYLPSLRMSHSKLFGYWTSELGALNEAVHIWEYDNFTHRTNVRQALAKDQKWIDTYVTKAFPYIVKQSNVVMSPLPWSPMNLEESSKPRVFELVCSTLLPGRLPQWEHQIQQGWNERLHHSQPIGMWKTIFGPRNNVYELWAYDSFDAKMAIEEKVDRDNDWKDITSHAVLLTQSSWNIGLHPITISPLK